MTDQDKTTQNTRLEQGNWQADKWSAVNDPANFLRIFDDHKRIALYLRDLRDLTVAAQRVTWLAFSEEGPAHAKDGNNNLHKHCPKLASAIRLLGNLVGVLTDPDAPEVSDHDHA